MSRLFIGLLLVAFISQGAIAASNCAAILQAGLWDNRYYEAHLSQGVKTRDWYCNFYRHRVTSSSDTSGLLGIEGLGLDFGMKDVSSSDQLTEKEACSDVTKAANKKVDVIDFWSTASKTIVNAWSSCVSSQSSFHGFKVWVTNTFDPSEFNIEFRFDAVNPPDGPKVSRILVTGSTCQSVNGLPFGKSDQNFVLHRQGASAVCARCPTQQVQISIASNELINGATDAASVITVPPAPEPTVGQCQLTTQVPIKVMKDTGVCVINTGNGTRNCDGENCNNLTVCYDILVPAPAELRDMCHASSCTPNGTTGNGCGHYYNVREQIISNQQRQMCYEYNSHTVFISTGFEKWEPESQATLKQDAPVPVQPGSSFSILWPTNAIDVKLSCAIHGNNVILDPRREASSGGVSVHPISSSLIESAAQVTIGGESPYAKLCKPNQRQTALWH